MKYFILSIFFTFVSCNKDEDQLSASQYIGMVKNGAYKETYLPKFSFHDIGTLIASSNDFTEIDYFPIQINLSVGPPRFTVGESLLWTVEAIRLFDLQKDNTRFPSNYPILCLKSDPLTLLTNEELTEVYNLYKTWWDTNKKKNFTDARKIDPLEESNFRWR